MYEYRWHLDVGTVESITKKWKKNNTQRRTSTLPSLPSTSKLSTLYPRETRQCIYEDSYAISRDSTNFNFWRENFLSFRDDPSPGAFAASDAHKLTRARPPGAEAPLGRPGSIRKASRARYYRVAGPSGRSVYHFGIQVMHSIVTSRCLWPNGSYVTRATALLGASSSECTNRLLSIDSLLTERQNYIQYVFAYVLNEKNIKRSSETI